MNDNTKAAPQGVASELTDAQILALNEGERFFSESPSRYPEAGHGTQYHGGAPGVIGIVRAALAQTEQAAPRMGAAPDKWIFDPHDIEQGMMLNPEWLKMHGTTAQEVHRQQQTPEAAPVAAPERMGAAVAQLPENPEIGATPAAVTDAGSEREQFEKHASGRALRLNRHEAGGYFSIQTDEAWSAWQARAALAASATHGSGEPVGDPRFVANVKAMYTQATKWPDSDWLDEFCREVWQAAVLAASPPAPEGGGR